MTLLDTTNAQALWDFLREYHRLVGPWVPSANTSRSWERRTPHGKKRICVRRDSAPAEPNHTEFMEWGGIDHEGYDAALASHAQKMRFWKPWSVAAFEESTRYYATRAEAFSAADDILARAGYMMLESTIPDDVWNRTLGTVRYIESWDEVADGQFVGQRNKVYCREGDTLVKVGTDYRDEALALHSSESVFPDSDVNMRDPKNMWFSPAWYVFEYTFEIKPRLA